MSRRLTERKVWSQDEIDRVMQLRDVDGLPLEEISERVGRTAAAIGTKLSELYYRESTVCGRGSIEYRRISQSSLEERDRRCEALERRSLTAAFFGDPPPGFSALDKCNGCQR